MRNWSVLTVKAGGLEIRIHLTFIVLLLFLLLIEINRSGPRVAGRVFMIAGLVLISALLHELAHTEVSRRQGFPIKGFVLLPIGGLAMGDPVTQAESARDLRKETLIALSSTEFVSANFATPIEFKKNDKGQIYLKESTPFDPSIKIK